MNQITSQAAQIALDTSKAALEKAEAKHREDVEQYTRNQSDKAWSAVEDATRLVQRASLDVRAAEDRFAKALESERANERASKLARLQELRGLLAVPRYRARIAPLVAKVLEAERLFVDAMRALEAEAHGHREAYAESLVLAGELGEQVVPEANFLTHAHLDVALSSGRRPVAVVPIAPSDHLERAFFVEDALGHGRYLGPPWAPTERIEHALAGTYADRARELEAARRAESQRLQERHAAEIEAPPRSILGPRADRTAEA